MNMLFPVLQFSFTLLLGYVGLVSSMGLINSREHIESLFEAKERGVASMQEYLQTNQDIQSKNDKEQSVAMGQN